MAVINVLDELGVEEPRGTAATLGDGDVFMHSHDDHGTGGHWCAKVIFFSLLAILIGLVGLIILENRGLSECKYGLINLDSLMKLCVLFYNLFI